MNCTTVFSKCGGLGFINKELCLYLSLCLQRHKVPEDDARLAGARELVSRNERRYNWTSGAQAQTQTGSDQGVDQVAEHETEHESQDTTEPGYEQVDQSVSAMT
jgi:hypothetical protein